MLIVTNLQTCCSSLPHCLPDSIRNLCKIPLSCDVYACINSNEMQYLLNVCPYRLVLQCHPQNRLNISSSASSPQQSPPAFSPFFLPLEAEISWSQSRKVSPQQPVALANCHTELSTPTPVPSQPLTAVHGYVPGLWLYLACSRAVHRAWGSAVSWSNQAEQPSDPDSPVTTRTLYS